MSDEVPKPEEPVEETTRMVTVRMKESLHEKLKEASRAKKTSMNKLCLQVLEKAVNRE